MQFRPPFGQPPSDQSWEPKGNSPQHPTQYQVDPQKEWQPQPPKKRSLKHLWLIIVAFMVLLTLVSAIGLRGTHTSSTERALITATSTLMPTHSEQPTSQSTADDIPTTTAGNLKNINPTYGTPTIEGHISDFIGKYGIPSTTNGKDMMWLLNSEGSLSLDVRDTGRGIVGYLSISTPGSWNLQKVQSFCLAFAPHDYRLDQISTPNNSSSLYVYDSPNGKFALHVSSGYPMYCFMNTLP